MQTTHKTPSLTLTSLSVRNLETGLVIIPFFVDDDLADEPGLDAASGGEIGRARDRGDLSGRLFEVTWTRLTQPDGRIQQAALVGAGPKRDFTPDRIPCERAALLVLPALAPVLDHTVG